MSTSQNLTPAQLAQLQGLQPGPAGADGSRSAWDASGNYGVTQRPNGGRWIGGESGYYEPGPMQTTYGQDLHNGMGNSYDASGQYTGTDSRNDGSAAQTGMFLAAALGGSLLAGGGVSGSALAAPEAGGAINASAGGGLGVGEGIVNASTNALGAGAVENGTMLAAGTDLASTAAPGMFSGVPWGQVLGPVAGAATSALLGHALAPAQVDYGQVAQQQAAANINTAQVQNQMNRVDTTTPYGSQTFQTIADPNVPGGYRYTSNIALSPEQQALYQSQVQGQQGQANIANGMLSSMGDQYSHPMDFSRYGQAQSAPTAPTFNPSSYGREMERAATGPTQATLGAATQQQYQNVGSGPQYQMQGANAPQGQTVGTAGQLQGTNAQGPAARDLYGQQGYSASVDAVRQSVLDQFHNANDKQFGQQSADLENKLKNMGLAEGTEAYDRELANLRQSQGNQANDAVSRAIQMGGQEQSRLAGIDLNADQQRFNQQQQGFGNQLSATGFNNQATQGNFNNAMSATGFNNNVGQQGYANQSQAITANNAARSQGFQDQLSSTGFNNANQRTSANDYYTQNMGNTGFNNAAGQQAYTNAMQGAGFNNAANQQEMSNWFTANNYNNQGNQQAYTNAMQGAQFNNANRTQAINEGIQQYQMPLQTYNAMRTGTQPTMPQFQPYGQAQVGQTPIMQAATNQQAQNNNMSNYYTGYAQQGLNMIANAPWANWFGNNSQSPTVPG